MIKLVVELSEGYIHERADLNNLTKLMDEKADNPLALMTGYLAFSSLENKIKDQSEFLISSQDVKKPNELKIFNDAVTFLLGILLGKNDKVHDANQNP